MPTITLCAFSDEASADFEGQIKALIRNRIPYMEIRGVDGKSIRHLTPDRAKECKKMLDDNGLAVWSIGSAVGKSDVDAPFCETEEMLRHICELARIFETDKVRMFSFYRAADSRQEVLSRLRRMVEIAREYGVELYHENEKDIFGDIADRVEDVMDSVDGLRHVYDPANFLQVGERAEETLRRFHHRADYFHIKDVIAETGELVPAGYGDGMIDRLVADIKEDKVLTVEPHLAVFDGYAQIDDTDMKHRFRFSTNGEAFDAAVAAIRKVILDAGYEEKDRRFTK